VEIFGKIPKILPELCRNAGNWQGNGGFFTGCALDEYCIIRYNITWVFPGRQALSGENTVSAAYKRGTKMRKRMMT